MPEPLATYLHDHLSGANFAIELLRKLSQDSDESMVQAVASELLPEIEDDRLVLRQVVDKIGETSHSFKEAVGWLGEKASRYKLGHEASHGLATFESLEVLTLGVLGKLGLWNALKRAAVFDPRLAGFDFDVLCARAQSQHARLEERRLAAVAPAFRRPST